jgi:hypothetical protein
MASMPGYELTEPWLTEAGLPTKGVWDVVYYAGEGKGKNGCKPMPKLRRAMLQLVCMLGLTLRCVALLSYFVCLFVWLVVPFLIVCLAGNWVVVQLVRVGCLLLIF